MKLFLILGSKPPRVSSLYFTNKTDRHDITEMLLKVALNIITQIKYTFINLFSSSSLQLTYFQPV